MLQAGIGESHTGELQRQLPLVTAAPLVTAHATAFRDLFENRRQYAHFEHYLTGLVVLENKSTANIARGVLDSADKTNSARFFSTADWDPGAVNERRIDYLLGQTRGQRGPKAGSALVLDDTLCEHVGSLFAHGDRHYNHGDGTSPLAHNPVTRFYVSGAVRFPAALRLYRRYEELTAWATFVAKHFPGRPIPTKTKERARRHKEVDPVLRQNPAFAAMHQQFRTKIDLAIELIESAIRHKVPFGVLLFDGWYPAEEVVRVAERRHCRRSSHLSWRTSTPGSNDQSPPGGRGGEPVRGYRCVAQEVASDEGTPLSGVPSCVGRAGADHRAGYEQPPGPGLYPSEKIPASRV